MPGILVRGSSWTGVREASDSSLARPKAARPFGLVGAALPEIGRLWKALGHEGRDGAREDGEGLRCSEKVKKSDSLPGLLGQVQGEKVSVGTYNAAQPLSQI